MICVAHVETNDFCMDALKLRWPNTKKFSDVCSVGAHNLPSARLICGGFPCQDVSVAGFRKGLSGERSTLFSEFIRIVCEIRPEWVVIENVPGLLSSDNGEFFKRILWGLHQAGYDAEWATIPACAFGAPHTRERVFIVANAPGARLQGDMRQVITQEIYDLSPKTLGSMERGWQYTRLRSKAHGPVQRLCVG